MTIPESEYEDCDSPCTPEEQRRIVTKLTSEAEASLKEGNVYYVISNRWYTSWQRFVGLITEGDHGGEALEVTRPGPIDNHDIIESEASNPELLKNLEEGVDYALVPQEVWIKLLEWYKGGPPLKRKMICHKSYSVEVYRLCLKVIDSRYDSCTIITISKQASISQLYKMVSAVTGVAKSLARIWDYLDKKKRVMLDPSSDKNLEESNLVTDQHILLEIDVSRYERSSSEDELYLDSSGSDEMVAGETVYSVEDDGYDASSASAKDQKTGLVGLMNLGNTCFMNSTLQCLAHTPPIVAYFLQDYSNDINSDNPLGKRGELAVAFGELLRNIWSSNQNAIAPRDFKARLAQVAPQFSGYGQHDSQEMLAFLLDGLHEDLNKVKKKPYIEAKDSGGRPDDEVAKESWNNHKARNDSVIVDVCQGQYKSTLVCPDCGKISITFDPFMYLSLPVPSSNPRSMTVAVFYSNGSRLWEPYTVIVPKNGIRRDLTDALGTACGLKDDESLLLAEVHDHKVTKYLEYPRGLLSEIKDNERIVAYRFKKTQTGPDNVKLEILHWEQEKSDYDKSLKLLGTPFVTYVKREPLLSGTDIDSIVSGLMSPLRRVPLSSTVDETEEDKELSLNLFLTDYGSSSFMPLESDSLVKPGGIINVLVKWDDKDHEKYDSSHMSDLPEVQTTSMSLKTREEGISLLSCLEAFLEEEPLGVEDMWHCPACKDHKQANKKLDLWKLPDILVFHLKRFTFNGNLKNKIVTFVNFPIHGLDLSKYVKSKDGQSYLYELYAISNHYGVMGSGHYTAYAKLMEENKWYVFNDDRVTDIDEPEIKTSAAYVLFYQRVKTESETSSKMDVD